MLIQGIISVFSFKNLTPKLDLSRIGFGIFISFGICFGFGLSLIATKDCLLQNAVLPFLLQKLMLNLN
jgi:hypothetical protein